MRNHSVLSTKSQHDKPVFRQVQIACRYKHFELKNRQTKRGGRKKKGGFPAYFTMLGKGRGNEEIVVVVAVVAVVVAGGEDDDDDDANNSKSSEGESGAALPMVGLS